MLTQKLLQDLLIHYFLEKEVSISTQVTQLIKKLNRIEALLDKRRNVEAIELETVKQSMITRANNHICHIEQVRAKTYADLKEELEVLKQELETVHSKFIEIE